MKPMRQRPTGLHPRTKARFRGAERLVDVFCRQGSTVAGFPRVRPSDCRKVTNALRALYEENKVFFRYEDEQVTNRFWALVERFLESDLRHYPPEILHVKILMARIEITSRG